MKNEPDVLQDIYGSKAFVKIKQCLEIGKMLFSFVNFQQGKTTEHIDCYMTAEEFGLFAQDIANRSLLKKIADEKIKGEKYPKAVWQSPLGGANYEGKPISRSFDISPSATDGYDCVFTARALPADVNDKGAFIPKKGAKASIVLRVPCTFKDLRLIQYKWAFLEKDYMCKKYSLESMKSTRQNQLPDSTGTSFDTGEKHSSQSQSSQSNTNAAAAFIELKSLTPVLNYGNQGYKCLKAISRDNKEMVLIIPPDEAQAYNAECQSIEPNALFRVVVNPYKDKFLVRQLKL